jgi:hypothetical protein
MKKLCEWSFFHLLWTFSFFQALLLYLLLIMGSTCYNSRSMLLNPDYLQVEKVGQCSSLWKHSVTSASLGMNTFCYSILLNMGLCAVIQGSTRLIKHNLLCFKMENVALFSILGKYYVTDASLTSMNTFCFLSTYSILFFMHLYAVIQRSIWLLS